MDWGFITHHLASGFIPEAAALMMYFILLHVIGKKQTAAHIIMSFVFCFYLVGILTMTGVCLKGSFSPRIVYIPFADMSGNPKTVNDNFFLLSIVEWGLSDRANNGSVIKYNDLPNI